ncbi:MAG TPA: Hsp20/alpha crystallin family protein [Dehalococcoidia bacterium]|nr:Hsp20/alpha crystallin family protein [Dehalococcoidia bacterium]
MTMQRWDPYGDMQSLRMAMDRLFEDAWVRPGWVGGREHSSGMPMPIDITEHDENLIVKASMPGVKPEDINITVQGNQLVIQGEMHSEEEHGQGQKGTVHHQEHRYGRYVRSMTLPSRVDAEKAEASFENGMLKLTLPKEEASRTRQIPVKGGKGQPIEVASKPAIEGGGHPRPGGGQTPTSGNGSRTEQPRTTGNRT